MKRNPVGRSKTVIELNHKARGSSAIEEKFQEKYTLHLALAIIYFILFVICLINLILLFRGAMVLKGYFLFCSSHGLSVKLSLAVYIIATFVILHLFVTNLLIGMYFICKFRSLENYLSEVSERFPDVAKAYTLRLNLINIAAIVIEGLITCQCLKF